MTHLGGRTPQKSQFDVLQQKIHLNNTITTVQPGRLWTLLRLAGGFWHQTGEMPIGCLPAILTSCFPRKNHTEIGVAMSSCRHGWKKKRTQIFFGPENLMTFGFGPENVGLIFPMK